MRYQLIAPRDEALSAVEQVLFNRGINPKDIDHFKYPSVNDLVNPEKLEHIKDGVAMLISHIERNDKIFIQVDSDCDGYTSSAILINYLNCLFPHYVQTQISYRIHDGKQHGLLTDTIPSDVKLVIAPDASSNDYEQHKELHDRGIDVLVIDHHEAEKYSEYACVINNQMCDYPTKSLSGAGVVYKFCSYIDQLLGYDYANDYIDLATVGIIADVMDLRDYEIREIILRGMQGFRNPLLKAMVAKDKFHFEGQQLTPFNIAWYIAPYINAITRSATEQEKLVVFESMIEYLAYKTIPSTKRGHSNETETISEQNARNCANARARQNKEKEKAGELLDIQIIENCLDENQILVLHADDLNVSTTLTGLCATEIVSRYKKPVLLGRTNSEGLFRGSVRGVSNCELTDTKQFLLDSNLMDYAEG